MIKKHKWVVIAAAGTLAVVMALTAVLVVPQAAQAAPTAALKTNRGTPPGESVGQVDTYLADALGITTDALNKAQEAARVAAIDQALEKGLITKTQADALKANQRLGWGGRGMLERGVMGFFDLDEEIDHEALLADALGISVEKLQAAQQTAADARIEQAVKDGKLTQEQADLMKAQHALQQYMQEQGFFATAVQKAVEAGVITQAQADSILSRQGTGMRGFGMERMPDRGGIRGFGGRGGHW